VASAKLYSWIRLFEHCSLASPVRLYVTLSGLLTPGSTENAGPENDGLKCRTGNNASKQKMIDLTQNTPT
jgi:hypothetical protein